MEMSPAEKMRDSILKELGLTEEELAALPPEQQNAIEEKIVERIKERSNAANSGDEDTSSSWVFNKTGGPSAADSASGGAGGVDEKSLRAVV
ncbi:hypothetical protein D9M68_692530 [compost metagenome]